MPQGNIFDNGWNALPIGGEFDPGRAGLDQVTGVPAHAGRPVGGGARHRVHLVALLRQLRHELAPDETAAPGDEDPRHAVQSA